METVGRWSAITVVTPAPWWWTVWLRFNFWQLERQRRRGRPAKVLRRLDTLAFISFAHWSVLRTRGGGRAPRRFIVFQSNFNGAVKQYVEAFSRVIPWGVRAMWAGAYGIHDCTPVTYFEGDIARHRSSVDHYWCAYPDGSTKIIRAALELRSMHQELLAGAREEEPGEFAERYDRFLAQAQHLI